MQKAMSSVVKGVAVGMAVGTATFMVANHSKSKSKALKKNAGKAMKAVGTIIDNVAYMMR